MTMKLVWFYRRDDLIFQIGEDDETDAQVTWEDQSRINAFSRNNAKLSDLEDKHEAAKVFIIK